MTASDVRDENRRTVVAEVLRQSPPASRASISRATGLTVTTVSAVVGPLVEAGLIGETRGESAGGKPPTDLVWNDQAQQIVAMDLSRSVGAVTDMRGKVIATRRWPDGHGRGRSALRSLLERLQQLIEVATMPVLGVGVAVPGVVLPDGVVAESLALGWHDESIVRPLEEQLGVSVVIINDTQSCALAEYWTSTSRTANFATVRIGEGIGAGLVLDGRLFGGAASSAGELGHLGLVPDGKRCACGNIGCVETVLAEPRIIERLLAAEPALADVGSEDPARFFAAVDGLCVSSTLLEAAIQRIGDDLGAAIAPLIGLLDIDVISIVGPISHLGPVLLDAVAAGAGRRALPALARRVHMTYSDLDDMDALVGAAGAVFHGAFGTL